MVTQSSPSRREFLKASATLSSGVLLGFRLPDATRAAAQTTAGAAATDFVPNAFIRISRANVVTILVNKAEMGQGVYTSLPMLIAEELEVDLRRVKVVAAPVDPAYNHPVFGMQFTGGSRSIASEWERLRKAGAAAREMLLAAAADIWRVDRAGLRAESGAVIGPGGRRLTYGQLAERAATMPVPTDPPLKDPSQFKIIGKSTRRLDSRVKVTGEATFGLDARVPGMLTAVVARPPVFGAIVKGVNAGRARAVRGVKDIVQIPSGVAVIATSFWSAKKGRDALEIVWEEGEGARVDTATQQAAYAELATTPGLPAKRAGDASAALAGAATRIQAAYQMPYLAHAPMEPLNCLVALGTDQCDIWTGTQFQTVDRANAAAVAGLTPEQVRIHTLFLGGGFGRRATPGSDFIVEAVHVAKAAKAPVKTVWTREDDLRGGYYRPMWHSTIAAGLDAGGRPVGWTHTLVGQSIVEGTPFASEVKDGVDVTSVEGAAELAYAVPNVAVDLHSPKGPVPVLWWRSVGHTHTGFVVESFIDELRPRGGQGSLRVPQDAARGPAPASRRARSGRAEGQLGRPAHRRPGPRNRGPRLVRELVRPGRRGLGPGPADPGPSRGLRDRLRPGDQPGDDPRPDGGRHRLRAVGRAVRADHAEGRARAAEQLPRLPRAPDRRDAGGRGAHRAERRAALRRRRARHAADGRGRLQCPLRVDGTTPAVTTADPARVRVGLTWAAEETRR